MGTTAEMLNPKITQVIGKIKLRKIKNETG